MRQVGPAMVVASMLLTAACSSPPRLESATTELSEVASPEGEPLAAAPQESLAYSISVAGLPVGHASLDVFAAGSGTSVQAQAETNQFVDLLYAVRGMARTRLDAGGRSKSFYLWVDEDGTESERALAFDEVPSLYYRPPGDEPWVASLTQFRAPKDPLGLLMELRHAVPADEPRDFEVAMTLRSFCYRTRFLGRAEVSVGAGDFAAALRWRVEVRPYRELDATQCEVGPVIGFYEIAFSDDARHLPLSITREFGFGMVALELEEATGRAEPALAAAR